MNARLPAALAALTCACVAPEPAPSAPPDSAPPDSASGGAETGWAGETVSVTGIAYQFRSHLLLRGATITVEEYPANQAVTDEEGRYTLDAVPAGVPVTLRVELAGHHTSHHQTFTLNAPLDRLYFQVVPDDLYDLIVGVLDSAGRAVDPEACQVVTTLTDPSSWAADSWEAFLERGDAGLVPGATADLSPASGERLYFNEVVLPDPTQSAATTDGGVLWLNVAPDATYLLEGQHPDGAFEFPSVEVTCAPGRLVNASPPYGLTSRDPLPEG